MALKIAPQESHFCHDCGKECTGRDFAYFVVDADDGQQVTFCDECYSKKTDALNPQHPTHVFLHVTFGTKSS